MIPSTPSVILSGCHKKLDTFQVRDNIRYKERAMSVQDHIENILNAEGQECLDAWYDAIDEHPKKSMDIHKVVVDHLVQETFMKSALY